MKINVLRLLEGKFKYRASWFEDLGRQLERLRVGPLEEIVKQLRYILKQDGLDEVKG
jgi:hypothetical protein